MNKQQNIIEKKIKDIFLRRFKTVNIKWAEDIMNTHLLSYKIGFKARHLLILFLELEKEFNIKIPSDEILNNNFTTLNKIILLIERLIK